MDASAALFVGALISSCSARASGSSPTSCGTGWGGSGRKRCISNAEARGKNGILRELQPFTCALHSAQLMTTMNAFSFSLHDLLRKAALLASKLHLQCQRRSASPLPNTRSLAASPLPIQSKALRMARIYNSRAGKWRKIVVRRGRWRDKKAQSLSQERLRMKTRIVLLAGFWRPRRNG